MNIAMSNCLNPLNNFLSPALTFRWSTRILRVLRKSNAWPARPKLHKCWMQSYLRSLFPIAKIMMDYLPLAQMTSSQTLLTILAATSSSSCMTYTVCYGQDTKIHKYEFLPVFNSSKVEGELFDRHCASTGGK